MDGAFFAVVASARPPCNSGLRHCPCDVLAELLEHCTEDGIDHRARVAFCRPGVTVKHQPLRRPKILCRGQEGGRIRVPEIIRAHAAEINKEAPLWKSAGGARCVARPAGAAAPRPATLSPGARSR